MEELSHEIDDLLYMRQNPAFDEMLSDSRGKLTALEIWADAYR